MVFAPMAQAPPKAGTKELVYSLNLIHEFTSLFSPKVTFAGSLRKAISQKHISVFLWLCKQRPRFAQGHPNVRINAIVFVPAAKTPKELSYNSLNLSMKDKAIADSILVSDQTDLFRFATYGDEYGVPRKVLPQKQANVDTGHQIRPRVISQRAIFQ